MAFADLQLEMQGPGWICKPMLLSVTTRGIGLNLCSFYENTIKNSSTRRLPVLPDIHAVYRALLAITENKLMKVIPLQHRMNSELITYSNRRIYKWSFLLEYQNYAIPVTIQRIIDAIGIFANGDEGVYFPVMSKNTVIEGRFVPRPENILLSNLRETVAALANPDNSEAAVLHRNNFYQNNPIPAATWGHNFTLINPEQIMPAAYDYDSHLQDDLNALNSLQNAAFMINRNFQRVNYNNSTRNKAILMSSKMSGLRAPDLIAEETLIEYYHHAQPKNDVRKFYSSVNLTHEELMEGATMLLGEQPIIINDPERSAYALRSKNLNPFTFNYSYKHSINYCQLLNN